MTSHTRRLITFICVQTLLFATASRVAAQAPPGPTTGVLATLSVKPDAQLAEIMKVMPNEVRDTVKLYLDGKIAQWFGKSDGRGVIFIINATSVAEAKAITDTLPLIKANLATFDFVGLTPLTPLRMLLAEPSAPKP
jgi:hypothetical protein